MKTVRVLNRVNYAEADYETASDLIVANAKARNSYAVFCMPVHGLVLACSDHPLSNAAERADLIVPDGQPVRWLMNNFYRSRLKDRVYGPTLTLHVLEKASALQLRVFLYGGSSDDVVAKFVTFIHTKYPGVVICGTYRESNPHGNTLTAAHIAAAAPHIVLVGRGCPAQELWIAENKGRVAAAMIGIGAAFSFHAGTLQQAPAWMQDHGLEWFYRLMREPRRLLKRYLVTNTRFMLLVFKEAVRLKITQSRSRALTYKP